MTRSDDLLARLSEKEKAAAGDLQREVRRLMDGGMTAERAVLAVTKLHGLSMADMELLHLAVKPKG
jgi:hypothetical protein